MLFIFKNCLYLFQWKGFLLFKSVFDDAKNIEKNTLRQCKKNFLHKTNVNKRSNTANINSFKMLVSIIQTLNNIVKRKYKD